MINIFYSSFKQSYNHQGKFLIKVLVGDLLQVEDLSPAISGVDKVSTVTSELDLKSF